jgi:hypothetical protein
LGGALRRKGAGDGAVEARVSGRNCFAGCAGRPLPALSHAWERENRGVHSQRGRSVQRAITAPTTR